MKKISALTLALMALTNSALSEIIYSTYDGSSASTDYVRVHSSAQNADWWGQDIAISFTNSAQIDSVGSVVMRMTDMNTNSFANMTVSINVDNNGTPGSSLGSLAYKNSDVLGNATFSKQGIALASSTVYWVVANAPDRGWMGNNGEEVSIPDVRWYKGTSATGYARRYYIDSSNSGWQEVQSASPAIMIIPEPASVSLILIAGGVLLFRTRILG